MPQDLWHRSDTLGVVILGELPATTEEVLVNGPALGPARLVRVEHEDGGMEVIAIDTREAGSLRHIMDGPAVEWSYESTVGSTPIEVDVSPITTAPLKLFYGTVSGESSGRNLLSG